MATSTVGRDAEILFREATDQVADLNNLVSGDTTRIRIVRWGGTTTAHAPSANYSGFCISYMSSANYACQLAMAANSGNIYTRYNNNGTWTAWKSVTPA